MPLGRGSHRNALDGVTSPCPDHELFCRGTGNACSDWLRRAGLSIRRPICGARMTCQLLRKPLPTDVGCRTRKAVCRPGTPRKCSASCATTSRASCRWPRWRPCAVSPLIISPVLFPKRSECPRIDTSWFFASTLPKSCLSKAACRSRTSLI